MSARTWLVYILSVLIFFVVAPCFAEKALVDRDPLPSWNAGPAKESIRAFVKEVTNPSSPSFVPPSNRIATFDNDGTLWSEKPVYFQLLFIVDRVKELATRHPEWKTEQPFKAVLEGDWETVATSAEEGLIKLVMATTTGMTNSEYEAIVNEWVQSAKHPRFKRPFTDLVFQPMLELLAYLRANEFKTFIVSGGGIEFMRPWTQRVYGVPTEQVIGSTVKTRFEHRNGKPVLLRLPQIDFINDKAGKPVGIFKYIGKRPIAAFGNSDGDLQMLQWTTADPGKRLGVIIHHTDAEREWAYDRKSPIGRLDKALDQAKERGWTVVDMKKDWKVIYPFER